MTQNGPKYYVVAIEKSPNSYKRQKKSKKKKRKGIQLGYTGEYGRKDIRDIRENTGEYKGYTGEYRRKDIREKGLAYIQTGSPDCMADVVPRGSRGW